MNFNPMQAPDFTAWYMSDLEIKVRSMVDELQFRYGHGEMPRSVVDSEMYYLGIDYNVLPQSCRDMIDELELY